MSVLEYAYDVGKNVDYIFELCKKLDINVSSEEDILKIYSLLGKKFYLHDIRFYVDSHDIRFADEGVQAKITKVIDYQTSKYYLVDILVGEAETQQLYVVGDEQDRKVDDIVHLDIKGEDIGVYDVNFGVKLS